VSAPHLASRGSVECDHEVDAIAKLHRDDAIAGDGEFGIAAGGGPAPELFRCTE
jgi:hypothetical protein